MAVVCPPSHPGCNMQQFPTINDHPDVQSDLFASAHPVDVSQEPPSSTDLLNVAMYPLLTEKGEEVPFHQLWRDETVPRRALIIFVRHFFCGNCQEYIKLLSETMTSLDLWGLPKSTSIAVVGCGQPEMIPFYRQATGCTFPIYSDPSRELYVRLGMARTMAPGDKKPDYVRKSMLGIVASGLTQGVAAGRNALKGGDFWQVGGEFLIENGEVVHCHRMSTTRDHVEVPELRRWLGFEQASEEEGDEEKQAHKGDKKPHHHRNIISEVGASMRRSMSKRRSSPSSGKSSRKGSDSSLAMVDEVKD